MTDVFLNIIYVIIIPQRKGIMKEYEEILMDPEQEERLREGVRYLPIDDLTLMIKFLDDAGKTRTNSAILRVLDDELERKIKQEEYMLR